MIRALLSAVPHVAVDLGGSTGYVLADDLERTAALEPWAALLPDARSDDDGLEGAGLVPGPHASVLFDSGNVQARPCGGKVASSVGGRNVVTARSGIACSRRRLGGGRDRGGATQLEDWLGDARVNPGFLPPFQRELSA